MPCTVTTTKLMQNIVCARMIVVMPFGTPTARNCAASPAPSTTSGVAIGRNSSRLIADRAPEAVAHERERDHRAERRRDERRDDADQDAVAERLADLAALDAADVQPVVEA